MVYTDGIHLIADSVEELHRFADKIVLSKCWFHNARGKFKPHYDMINSHTVDRALMCGAKLITKKEIVKILNKKFGNSENI